MTIRRRARSRRERRRDVGLQSLLVALVAIGIVPLLGLTVYSNLEERERAIRTVGDEASRVGRLAALREADLIEGGRELLATIAQDPAVRTREGGACSAQLEALLPLYPRFANIGVVDANGTLFCSARSTVGRGREGMSFADRAWFRRAVETGRFAVGDYQVGRITGRPSLVFGLPVVDEDNELQAVAWAALDLRWLQQFATAVQLPGEPALTIVDRNETVLARHPNPERWVGTRLPRFTEAALRNREVTVRGLDGVRRLYTFTPLGDPDNPHAIVSVGIPTSVAYADANQRLRRDLVLVAAIAAMGLLAARAAGDRLIVKPARSLVAVSRRLAEGDLSTRVAPPYPTGELGVVSRAFDDMAGALEARDAALQRAIADQQTSEARFRLLLETAPDAIIAFDGDGTIRLVNRKAESLFGCPANEIVGQRVDLLVAEDWRQLRLPVVEGASSEPLPRPRPAVGITARRLDGTTFPAEVTAAALDTDEGVLVSAAIRDVTERKAAEEALARGREQLQSILDNAPAAIHMQDAGGRYAVVNRRFENIWGVDREDVIGKVPEMVFDAGAAARFTARHEHVLRMRAPVEHEDQLPLHGVEHTYLSVTFPLADSSGTPYATCGISTDITERIQAQAEREMLEAQLHRAQRLESLGQLAGGVAHDYNNLLNVILNYADFIQAALADVSPDRLEELLAGIRDDVDAIRRAGETAAALTRQLLIFGRRDKVEATAVDLGSMVTGLEPLLRRAVGENITLEIHAGRGLWPVRADRGRFEQVVMNLALNARDAMPEGGTLTITVANAEVDGPKEVLPPGRYVALEVRDNGVGMEREVADRAFEPFFTTKPKGRGTGLGLATVFGVVSEAGGYAAIESTPGQGTAVRLHLPASPGSVPLPDRDGSGAPAVRHATVLVVEDEDAVREVTRRVLSGHGYHVLSSSDPVEAVRLCEEYQHDIDLVLTDVVMPGLSGPELVKRVRSLRPQTRALYMSGYPEDLLAERHAFDDDVTLIGKPFTAEQLLGSVSMALDSAETRSDG